MRYTSLSKGILPCRLKKVEQERGACPMLHSLSFGELALIFGIVLVLFGGSRLASVGKSLGEGIANFKRGLNAGADDKSAPAEAPAATAASSTPTSTLHAPQQLSVGTASPAAQRVDHVVDAETKV